MAPEKFAPNNLSPRTLTARTFLFLAGGRDAETKQLIHLVLQAWKKKGAAFLLLPADKAAFRSTLEHLRSDNKEILFPLAQALVSRQIFDILRGAHRSQSDFASHKKKFSNLVGQRQIRFCHFLPCVSCFQVSFFIFRQKIQGGRRAISTSNQEHSIAIPKITVLLFAFRSQHFFRDLLKAAYRFTGDPCGSQDLEYLQKILSECFGIDVFFPRQIATHWRDSWQKKIQSPEWETILSILPYCRKSLRVVSEKIK